jgi:glycerophosphoryl diester phosphodiesterase
MIRIIGHRGARNLWAENSLGGFRRTVALGVDAVELDLHLTSDGEIVVIHDPLLERTTTGNGPVTAHSLAALREKVRLRDTVNETLPTLAEVLDIFRPTGIELELEIKMDARGLPYPGLVEKTVAMVAERGMTERVMLTCFVPEIIEEFRRRVPQVRRLASIDRRSCELLGGLERTIGRFLDLDCIIALERTLFELDIERCVAMVGKRSRIGAWVPNTPQDLAFWMRQPIHQMTSDRPDLALLVRAALTGGRVEGL